MTRTLIQQILAPRCPKCGEGKLLSGILKVREACEHCGLMFKFHDTGDGPVFFAITIVGTLIMAAAGVMEYHLEPPMWLHAALWIPLTFILCIAVLRAFKAGLILLEYRTGLLKQKEQDT